MEDLSVEVYGENGAYYKAIVTDVLDNEVLVTFENDWQPESKFPFSQVFLPPKDTGKHTEFVENQEVEVFARSNEKEACGWWTANIKMMRGEFLVIEYLEWDNCYTEIVPKDRLRVKTPKTPIDKNTFHKFEIPVPDDLKEYAKVENAHKEFQKAIGAALVWFVPERGALAVISRCETSQRRATMLQEMHFRNLTQKLLLLKKTEEAARQLESTKIHNQGGYTDEFSVREDLMGLAIGTHGANIQQARKVPGITNIELEEHSCTFKICGEPRERNSPIIFNSKDIEMSQSILQSTNYCGKLTNVLETTKPSAPVYKPEDNEDIREDIRVEGPLSQSFRPPKSDILESSITQLGSPPLKHNSEEPVDCGSPAENECENKLSSPQRIPKSVCPDCVQCQIMDKRNYHFCQLLMTELQFLHPCTRTVAYHRILKIVDGLKGSHSKDDIKVVNVKPGNLN